MRRVPGEVQVLRVVLATPYDVALRRASQDCDRVLSANPDFLRADHDRFHKGQPDLACDLALDGAEATATALAQRVVDSLDALSSSARCQHPRGQGYGA